MQIVIDIDESYYELVKHEVKHGNDFLPYKLLANGIPLPKGHGRIVDIDKLIHYKCNECGNDINCSLPCYAVRRMLDAPIIIEADRSEK